MPVRPSFSLGERADFGFGLGDALRRGKALLRRVFATDLLASISLSRVTTHVQCDDFPTSSPMTILAFSVVPWWYPPIGRPIGSPPLDTHITWPWPPGPAVSYQSFGAASVLGGNTSRALEGQGQTAIRGRPIGGPSGLGQTVGHAPNDRHRSSSMAYLRL